METNHKSKHEKVFAPWFVQSVGKFDEGELLAFGLTTHAQTNRVPNPLNTVSKTSANQLPKALPKAYTNQHGTQIKRLSPRRKVTYSSSHAPPLHKSKHSLSVSTRFQRGRGGTKPWQSLPRHPLQTWVPTSSGQGGIIFFMVTLLYNQPTQNKNSGGGV